VEAMKQKTRRKTKAQRRKERRKRAIQKLLYYIITGAVSVGIWYFMIDLIIHAFIIGE
jgi:cytoskeletal protein RodZ